MSKNQKGKGLGRGIDALFMNDLDTIDALEQVQDSEQIQQIAVSEIRPNPYQPRKEFDEEGLAELAESIRQNGVFQPIIVRKSKIKGYELVAGERRLRASKLAEKETIPAIVRSGKPCRQEPFLCGKLLTLINIAATCTRTRSKRRIICRACTYFAWIKRSNENLTSR